MTSQTNDIELTRASLRQEFPSWTITRTRDTHRWWATRGPKPGEQINHGVSAVDADTPELLREALREVVAADAER